MKKEQPEGIFVISENTHHYNGAPSDTRYTFMKGRGLWITDPKDIAFFKGKVERGSGFHIEKEATNIADNVKVVKKDKEEKAPSEPLTKKLKDKITGSKKKPKDPKAEAIIKASEEKLQKALEVLNSLDEQDTPPTPPEDEDAAEGEGEEELPEEIAALVAADDTLEEVDE